VGKLAGKIAVVTGGSSGIGRATALRFVAEGARVFVFDQCETQFGEGQDVPAGGLTTVRGSVCMLPDLDRLVATISQQTNYVDILFANAGVLSQSLPIGEVSENEFDATFDVNVKAVFFTVQKLLPLLRDGASIILNASAVSAKGLPAYSVYTATKAAVRSFARTWSSDLKARQIRVNAVSPGPIETPMMTAGKSEEELRQHKASLSSVVPVGRVGQPDDVARAVVFLASSDSSFITGIELFVDGGMAQV